MCVCVSYINSYLLVSNGTWQVIKALVSWYDTGGKIGTDFFPLSLVVNRKNILIDSGGNDLLDHLAANSQNQRQFWDVIPKTLKMYPYNNFELVNTPRRKHQFSITECNSDEAVQYLGFVLVSLFNGMSTFVGYSMPKLSLLKNSSGTSKSDSPPKQFY